MIAVSDGMNGIVNYSLMLMEWSTNVKPVEVCCKNQFSLQKRIIRVLCFLIALSNPEQLVVIALSLLCQIMLRSKYPCATYQLFGINKNVPFPTMYCDVINKKKIKLPKAINLVCLKKYLKMLMKLQVSL